MANYKSLASNKSQTKTRELGCWGCSLCKRDPSKQAFLVPSNTSGLKQLIEHWKAEHPGRVTTSGGLPVEEMPMDWANNV